MRHGKKRRTKLQHLSGTPLTFKVGEQAYKLAPLNLAMWAKLEEWASRQPFEHLEAKLANIKDEGLRAKVEEKLIAEAIEISGNPDRQGAYTESSSAVMLLFSMMMKVHQPDISEEEIEEIFSLKGMIEIRSWVEELSVVKPKGEPEKNLQTGK